MIAIPRVSWRGLVVSLAVLVAIVATHAQDMPDASLIHGRAIPAAELANGTVTVRVVREAIGNNIPGQSVRVTVNGVVSTAVTDELGRAEFSGLPQDQLALAEVTVDGEPLVSEPFAVPASGGLRVILVAGMAAAAERRGTEAAAEAAAPAVPGLVVFGGDSRVLVQFTEDALDVYYLLEIENSSRTRVDAGGPLVIDLPPGAQGAAALEGSSPAATVATDHVTIAGPFASGTTAVQVAFRMPHDRASLTIAQTWPAALQQVIVAVQKVGALSVSSPQLTETSEVPFNGQLYVLGAGPALAAGDTLTFTLSGLPVHSATPRYVAITLAVGLLGLGTWLSLSGRGRREEAARMLVSRRETLLNQLAQVEARHRAGTVDGAAYAKRRAKILDELEGIYGALDEEHARPQGGGEGVAA
jgi:hypothetical protein